MSIEDEVRHYTTPLDLRRACWRDDGPTGCTCRELAVDERAFGL